MSDMELAFAKQRIQELEQSAAHQRSAVLTLLLDLQVMLESGEIDEALDFLKQHTEPVPDQD